MTKDHRDKTDRLDELPTAYLHCRTFGHPWEEFVPVGMRKPEHGFRFSLLCVSCGTERHDLLNLAGEVVTREYRYASAYQVSFKASRADYRVALDARKRRVARRGDLVVAIETARGRRTA